MVDSNIQREHILPSEKAFAYKMKLEAMSRQGKRTDLTSDQVGRKLETAEIIGEQSGESKNQIRRYIRLTYLNKQLLDMVDEGRIAFTPAVELSYLNEIEQQDLVDAISECDATPNLSQACRLKMKSQGEGLTPEIIGEIMCEKKTNQKEMLKIPMDDIRKSLPNASEKQAKEFILKACEHYRKYLNRQQNHDER
jgi:ParB family chromosome partitioning protein